MWSWPTSAAGSGMALVEGPDEFAGAGFAYDVSPIRMEDGTYRDEIRDGVATAQ